ncbi:hypothetical protein M501DRAFT_944746 [Patellaria atrata CBS 101060]|uniref:Uncharacterized protein n=1 Tax=Patellaria atrata CBS 101060 TaxID=1346257 RepID=A0A9P4VM04_9PEZI|nr:hypothetical protein M501DRAFT_944746 [Patellaria atrata CBS 101060]
MAEGILSDRRPLVSESSELSDLSTPPHLYYQQHSVSPLSPRSPFRSRPGYSRLESDQTIEEEDYARDQRFEGDIADSFDVQSASRGLGITTGTIPNLGRRISGQSIARVPVGSKHASRSSASPSHRSLSGSPFSPPSNLRHVSDLSGSAQYEGVGGHYDYIGPENEAQKSRSNPSASISSLHSGYEHQDSYQRVPASGDNIKRHSAAISVKSAYERDFDPPKQCSTRKHFYRGRANWLAISILVVAVYSTALSGIFLIIAFNGTRWGHTVRTNGPITPSNAGLVVNILAKTVELSFVALFVAFLGQVLSRRAFMKEGKGVTLAEWNMRSWILQPATMFTHWEAVKYAALSVLGASSLIAAIVAMLYTTAANALVTPQLKFSPWERRVMQGRVVASFANPKYIGKQCPTPIPFDSDPSFGENTCVQIEHAAQGYHNYQRFLRSWDMVAGNGNGSTDMETRPKALGLLHENTTVIGSWVETINETASHEKFGRIINNVSLAMPHAGIFEASRNQINGLMQPEELDGLGVYSVHASVPNPVANVLCTNVKEEEIAPLIYDKWPHAKDNWTSGEFPGVFTDIHVGNRTVFDEVFGWKNESGRQPPFFAKLPKPFNTILNQTGIVWARPEIYLLAAGGDALAGLYSLCSIKVSLTANCSARYNATAKGGTMETLCEDPFDEMTFIKSLHNATTGIPDKDWKNVGSEWANSLSLNTGINDANASNSRILSQLILRKPSLNPALPSIAEAIAVLASCTLLQSSQDSPFVQFWNYSATILDNPQFQYFNASIRAQEYTSGGTDASNKAFFPVLLLVFLTNIGVLAYFLIHKGLVTDFSEPPNLLTIAINSPPSHLLAGSCGGGPEGDQYKVNWYVNTEGDHLFMESGERPIGSRQRHFHRGGATIYHPPTPNTPGLHQSPADFQQSPAVPHQSPVMQMYAKLAKRTSRL